MVESDTDDYEFPVWDEKVALSLNGSLVLIGVTYRNPDGSVKQQVQAYGIVTKADKKLGISIDCHGEVWRGKSMTLPPDLRGWRTAELRKYRLRTTGETVVDPAYTCAFSIVSPQN
jgi:hypothetical protein